MIEKTQQYVDQYKKNKSKDVQKVTDFDPNSCHLDLKPQKEFKTLKISAWNVNGLRAVLRKGALNEYLDNYEPDIMALSEIKIDEKRLQKLDIKSLIPNYMSYFNCCKPPHSGYSGVGILTKVMPMRIIN